MDRGRNRTRPPTPAEDRQWQENTLFKAPGEAKDTGEGAGATQVSKAEKEEVKQKQIPHRSKQLRMTTFNQVGQRSVQQTPNAP
ncbi:MAG TPA: hypothetical protein VE133_12320 [Candidatus Sulfotelmatobacter sp.]|nr:hypothetical protein [Candidatus Sulfotelmatobacter sp.]